jgi:hypothetical protein
MMMVVAMLTTSRRQFQTSDASRNVEPGFTRDADGLQREGVARTADQRVRAQADTDRGARGRSDVKTGEATMADVLARSEYHPSQNGLSSNANINAITTHGREITLRFTDRRTEDAAELVDRAYDEADRAVSSAVQHARLYTRLGNRRRRRGDRKKRGRKNQTK